MTAITEMDLWEMFLDALEDNDVSYNNDQLDVIHKHMRQLEVELEAAQ